MRWIDDLIMRCVELFQSHPAVGEKYRTRFLHLLVDEFQDTNHAQYILMKELVGAQRNICVVGDPDQSIYRFRGAEIRNILDFELDFKDGRVCCSNRTIVRRKNDIGSGESFISPTPPAKKNVLWTIMTRASRSRSIVLRRT